MIFNQNDRKKIIVSIIIVAVAIMIVYIASREESRLVYMPSTITKQPTIAPTPHTIHYFGGQFSLPSTVYVVAEENTNPNALKELEQTLRHAGVKTIKYLHEGELIPQQSVAIWIGKTGWKAIEEPLNELAESEKQNGNDELPDEGYLLSVRYGEDEGAAIVLAGADDIGTYYATLTLGQLINTSKKGSNIPEVYIKDYPDLAIRGVVEGYYGVPIPHEDRLSLIEYIGDHKMNSYVYAPKDDLRHRLLWREPYSSEEMEQFRQLVQTAEANQVRFVFSLSPGNDICYSCDQDFELLLNKFQAMWDIGVREFSLLLDDIAPTLHHNQDAQRFNAEPSPTASAQAFLLNRFNEQFIKTHPGAWPLIACPTEYYQPDTSIYREQFAALVDKDILVYWTGINSAATITKEDADKITAIFQHELLVWNNYPNNDYVIEKLHLAPLLGRDPNMHNVAGLTANIMEQAQANKIALYTVADYTWNTHAFDPWRSWEESLQEFGGPLADTLKVFAENNLSSPLYGKESAALAPLIEAFWSAYSQGEAEQEAKDLLTELKKLEELPEALKGLENQRFLDEVGEWLEKASFYGTAGQNAVQMLMAQQSGDKEQAAKLRTLLEDQLKQNTIDVEVAIDRKAIRRLDGVNIGRGEHQLIMYTPDFGERTDTNPWGYEVTVVDGRIVKTGGNNNPIPRDGYVLSLHYNYALDTPDFKWLQDNTIEGASVELDNNVVTINMKKGIYPVTNKKETAKGVLDVFINEAIQTYR